MVGTKAIGACEETVSVSLVERSNMALPSSCWFLLSIVILAQMTRPSFSQDTFSSGVFSAWVGEYSPLFDISGDVNVFVTEAGLKNGFVGFNGALFGLPVNDTAAHVILHESEDCEELGEAAVYGRSTFLNRTLSSAERGVSYFAHFDTFDDFDKEFVRWKAVGVYLGNGTLAGCGTLYEAQDSSVLTSVLNAFPGKDGFQADVTFITYTEHPILCYFGTAVGIEPTVGEGEKCAATDAAPQNNCGIQIRSQTTCEEDLMQDTVFTTDDPFMVDPWRWSKYFWSTSTGFSAFSQCLDIVADSAQDETFDLVVGNSLIAYDTEGIGIGCGSVQPYEPPPSVLTRSDLYCGLFTSDDATLNIWGAIFVFQNPEVIRNGVMGVAGHVYGLEEECTDECEVVLFEADGCEGDLGNPVLTAQVNVDSTGSVYGVLDVLDDNLEHYVVALRLGNGDIATCDFLKEVADPFVYQTKTVPYSGRAGSGEIVSTSALAEDFCTFGVVYGLQPNIEDCGGACFYHVNEGTSCDELEHHLYNKDVYGDESPWQESRYVSTDEYGVGFFGGCVETFFEDEYDYSGRAFVVRGPDNLPSSCGLVTAFEPFVDNSMCDICPLDGYEMTKPDEKVNFGGQVDVTCTALKQTADTSYRTSTDPCIELQQFASLYCGCSQDGLTALSKTSSARTVGVIAAVAAVALAAAAGYFCFVKSKSKFEKTVGDLALEQQQTASDRAHPQQINESLASPIALEVHETVVHQPTSSSTRLTGKNQLQGESFWQNRGSAETPYAQVVAIEQPSHEEDSKPSPSIQTASDNDLEI